MGCLGGSTPPPPDYKGAAEASAKSDKEALTQQTWANRPTQTTPWGSTSWETGSRTDPGTGQSVTTWTQNETLDPKIQQALDAQLNIQKGRSGAAETLLGQATGAFQTPMDWNKLPGMGTLEGVGYKQDFSQPGYKPGMVGDQGYQRDTLGPTNFNAENARNRAEEALYQRQMSRIEPGLQQSEAARRSRLANMGISPEGGSEAWNRAQTGMDTSRNQAYNEAAMSAIIGGGQEATREMGMAQGQQGMDMNRGNYNLAQAQGAQGLDIAREQANMGLQSGAQGLEQGRLGMATSMTDTMNRQRQQAIAEEQLRRGMPLNELNALLTGQQVGSPNMPSFQNAGKGAATDYMGAARATGDYNTANKEEGMDIGSLIGTGAKVAGMAGMISDRRLKKNIVPLGRGWYAFSYLWDDGLHFGVMAQEQPHAAFLHPSGYLMVDYGRL